MIAVQSVITISTGILSWVKNVALIDMRHSVPGGLCQLWWLNYKTDEKGYQCRQFGDILQEVSTLVYKAEKNYSAKELTRKGPALRWSPDAGRKVLWGHAPPSHFDPQNWTAWCQLSQILGYSPEKYLLSSKLYNTFVSSTTPFQTSRAPEVKVSHNQCKLR